MFLGVGYPTFGVGYSLLRGLGKGLGCAVSNLYWLLALLSNEVGELSCWNCTSIAMSWCSCVRFDADVGLTLGGVHL